MLVRTNDVKFKLFIIRISEVQKWIGGTLRRARQLLAAHSSHLRG
jgi:hypothetical protein